MTDNGLEDVQMSQFEAPEKAAARYSSQAEPHSWPHCIMRRPITLVLLFAAILVIDSMGVERGYRHLFTDKKTARYVCIRVCVALCMLGRGGGPRRIRNVGAVIRVGARSYL